MTAARVYSAESAHWYDQDGQPRHFVIGKNGKERPATLRDARENGWLPSPTSLLKILHKPAITAYLVEQAVMACCTDPRIASIISNPALAHELDGMIKTILATERQQDQHAAQARDLGSEVHAAIEAVLNDRPFPVQMGVYVNPVISALQPHGRVVGTERVLVGDGYAGKVDCILENEHSVSIVDFKTTGSEKLPTSPYWEHEMQVGAYAKALGNTGNKRIQGMVIYIWTKRPGEIAALPVQEWQHAYRAFVCLLNYWSISNNYDPRLER